MMARVWRGGGRGGGRRLGLSHTMMTNLIYVALSPFLLEGESGIAERGERRPELKAPLSLSLALAYYVRFCCSPFHISVLH